MRIPSFCTKCGEWHCGDCPTDQRPGIQTQLTQLQAQLTPRMSIESAIMISRVAMQLAEVIMDDARRKAKED